MLLKRFSNKIGCTLGAYWKYALTEEYNHCLYVDVLKYREYKLLHAEDTGECVHRRIQYAPPPPGGALRKLSGRFRASLLTETLVFDKSTGCASIDYIPSAFSERAHIRASISCTPVDGESIERVSECELSLDLPIIRGLAERTLASFLEEQMGIHAKFSEDYVRQRERHDVSLM
jgi:hypothetical protein